MLWTLSAKKNVVQWKTSAKLKPWLPWPILIYLLWISAMWAWHGYPYNTQLAPSRPGWSHSPPRVQGTHASEGLDLREKIIALSPENWRKWLRKVGFFFCNMLEHVGRKLEIESSLLSTNHLYHKAACSTVPASHQKGGHQPETDHLKLTIYENGSLHYNCC